MSLLEIDQLSIAFRRYAGLVHQTSTLALAPLSLSLKRGEVLALVGASGAGKSLLAHALFGILPANTVIGGSVRLAGTLLDAEGLAACRGRRMALVPQSISHLDPLARCGRQLRWAARRAGVQTTSESRAALLARFGLDAAAERAFPHQLSGGMARRMLLAMAAIGQADLVVADEPTSGLDQDNALAVLAHLRALAALGRGVLLITHDLALALPFADRVALLREGHLAGLEPARAFAGTGSALTSPYARALWQALPQNGFLRGEAGHA